MQINLGSLLAKRARLNPNLEAVVEFVDEIPRNLSGKILKRVLREQFPGPAPE